MNDLTISEVSYQRGMLDGQPCIVVYNATLDTTMAITAQSRGYRRALKALEVIEATATPNPFLRRQTIIQPGRIDVGRH